MTRLDQAREFLTRHPDVAAAINDAAMRDDAIRVDPRESARLNAEAEAERARPWEARLIDFLRGSDREIGLVIPPEETRSFLRRGRGIRAQTHPGVGLNLAEVRHDPVPTSVLDTRLRLVPWTEGFVKPSHTGAIPVATAAPFGTAGPSYADAWTGSPGKLERYTANHSQDERHVGDVGAVETGTVEWLRRGIRAGLAQALTSGLGAASDEVLGILNEPGRQVLDAAALTPVQALSQAATLIHNRGFEGPVEAVGDPVTVNQVLLGNVRDETPAITSFIASSFVPSGTVIVGDWSAGSVFVSPVEIVVRRDHADNFTRSILTFVSDVRAFASWTIPTGFVVVSNVS